MRIFTQDRSKRKKPSNKTLALRQERKEFFASILGCHKPKQFRAKNMPDHSYEDRAVPVSNNLHETGGFKKSVDDWKWKRGREESAETIKEIEKKKSRIAPAWNKGANQYITDGDDPKTLGRKI